MKSLKTILDLVGNQEKDETLWNNGGNLKVSLKELHKVIKEVIDLDGLKRNFCRLYGDPMINLKVHNTVYAMLKVADLEPLAGPGNDEFQSTLLESIKKNGLKDPLAVHFVTQVPMKHRHGCLIKTGNNRYLACKELDIKEVPCIVTNLSGNCQQEGCYRESFIEGAIIRTSDEVRKYFHSDKVNVVFRDGMVVNCYTPYFLRCRDIYSQQKK